MKTKESLLKKKISVQTLGKVLGGTVVMAIAAGLFWHRRELKRLVEIGTM